MTNLIALDLSPGPAFVDALHKIWDEGDAALPIDARLAPPARARLIAELRPSRVIDDSGSTNLANGRALLPGDALVVATSGTTGAPKGVVHTHRSVLASARITSAALGVDPRADHWVACLPLAHIGGLSVVTRAVLTGTALTVLPAPDRDALAAAQHNGATMVSLVPTALGRIDPDQWRVVLLGGSAMPPNLPSCAVRTYGMTETGSGIVYDGYALEGVELAIDTATSEVRIRTPTLARAYLHASSRPEGTPLADSEGWFATGDAGALEPDGLLSIRGRIATVIVSGGEKIWPESVEPVLATVDGVREVAIVGVDDEHWGQRVVALVVAQDPLHPPTLDALRQAVRAQLAPYMAPKELRLVTALPRTTSGKVARADLPR